MAFSFDDDESPKSNRYGNSRMDNLLAGEMKFVDDEPPQQQMAPPPPGRAGRERRNQQESFQQERDYSTTQQKNLLDVTEQNTIANSKQNNNNLGYDPSEFMVMDDNTVSSNVNDVNLFIRVMLGLILFFQIFIIFRLFTRSAV